MATNASSVTSEGKHTTSSNYENVSERIKQWNRAIPEAGYITLGTIRYGVKLAKPKHLSYASSGDDKSIDSTISENLYNDSSNSSNRAMDNKNCCCIGTSEIVMPWNTDYVRSRLPVSANLINNSKNRTLSTSSSSIATERTSQPVGGCLVIGNRDSSPPTCCYTTSSSTKIPNIFNSTKSTNAATFVTSSDSVGKVQQRANDRASENKLKTINAEAIDTATIAELETGPRKSSVSSILPLTLARNTDRDPLVQCHGDSRSNDHLKKNGNGADNGAKNLNNNDKLNSFKCCAPAYSTQHTSAADTTDQVRRFVSAEQEHHYQHRRSDHHRNKRHPKSCHSTVDPAAIIRYGYMSPSTTLCHQNKEYPIVRKLTPKFTRKLLVSRKPSAVSPDITTATTTTTTNTSSTIECSDINDDNDDDDGNKNSNKYYNTIDDDGDGDGDDDLSFIDSSVSQFSSSTSDENLPITRTVPVDTLHKNSDSRKISNIHGAVQQSLDISHSNWDSDIDCSDRCVSDRFERDTISINNNNCYRNSAPVDQANIGQKPIVPNTIVFIADEEDIDFENKSIPLVIQHPSSPSIGYRRIKVESAPKALSYFGKNPTYNRLLPAPIMEKRRNTLDRWQRLGFGKRSSSSNSTDGKGNQSKDSKRGVEKTERLRELTEMLKRTRTPMSQASAPVPVSAPVSVPAPVSAPAPVPPPRKPRQSIDMQSSSCSSLSINKIGSEPKTNDICSRSDKVQIGGYPTFLFCTPNQSNRMLESMETESVPEPSSTIKQGTDDATLILAIDPSSSPENELNSVSETSEVKTPELETPPLAEKEDDLFTALPKMESRTIIGAYTQKNIPYRSASFSQVDYSSGKYIRSAINAFKSNLNKQKASSVVENANLTLPRKKNGSKDQGVGKDDVIEDTGTSFTNAVSGNTTSEKEKSNLSCSERLQENVIEESEHEIAEDTLEQIPEKLNEENAWKTESQKEDLEGITNNQNIEQSISNLGVLNVVQASEMILDSLCEEELALSSSPNKNVFQTATQCLIPVPVYDCAAQEWDDKNTTDQWINACEDDSEKIIEEVHVSLDKITEIGKESDEPEVKAKVEVEMEAKIEAEIEANAHDMEADTEVEVKAKVEVEVKAKVEAEMQSEVETEIEPKTQIDVVDITEHNPEDGIELIKELEGKSLSEKLSTVNVDRTDDSVSQISQLDKVETVSNYRNPLPESESLPSISVTSNNLNGSDEQKLPIIDSFNLTVEIVEVRKRHSNDGRTEKSSDNLMPTNDPNRDQQNSSSEDRRRIDKSKRRKGIYIQWPAIDKDKENSVTDDWISPTKDTLASESGKPIWDCAKTEDVVIEQCTDIDLSNCDFSSITTNVQSKLEKLSNENLGWIVCKTPEDSHTPGSVEPTTPESDSNRMIWPKSSRKQSLTCQSSEEKDESISGSSTSIRANQKFNLLRYESVSDNESDRTSPRGRASQSPAPSDQDLKRYSKRPLRGPYGQMLEAEMKKPAKLHYDEILEELNRSDSSNKSKDLTCNETTRLPVPYHTRASSTPIRTELVSKDSNHNHRRFPSSVDSTSAKKDLKNFYLDKNSRKVSSCDVSEKSGKKCENDKLPKSNLDDVRLTQSVRNLSDKNLVLTKGQLQASPALLAELLKGSSEKLLSEQISNRSGSTGPVSPALPTAVLKCLDTRTHVVVELYNTEQSYVESLETIVSKYLNPLKSADYASIVDAQTVDEIFLMVPAILNIHERFLDDLRRRLDAWDPSQKVGDAFVEVFSKTYVLDTYTAFVNNWNRAKDAIRTTSSTRPSFARFLETMAREHKGKLTLDYLLIKPVQKFPNYELILSRLIKHTDIDHPDHKPLQEALKLVHDILLHLNCKEREALENDQREAALRELEGVIEGISDLVTTERQFLLFDLVSMPSGQAGRKDRGFFLFSDLLVITSIKRRSGTIRKPNLSCPGSVASTLDTNKYKLLMKISIEDLEIVKAKDENVRKIIKEIENLSDDFNKLQQILEIVSNLRCHHQILEENVKELQRDIQRQLSDKQTNDSQLNLLELTLNTPNSVQQLSVVFSKPIKRTQWEQIFVEAKQKLAASMERHPVPEFLASIPIRKTRAGLQFTCAAPTLGHQRDVWVCNSDGYVGQVCVLSLVPEPTVTSCNGVCNARILCVASVPANGELPTTRCISISIEDTTSNATHNHSSSEIETKAFIKSQSDNIQLDSSSSSEESDNENQQERPASPSIFGKSQTQQQSDSNFEDLDNQQSTMWLGTEDGCIHVYNCTDNIRIKKNKIKIQHISAVYSILYLDNRVFVSLSNGDIVVYLREQNGWNTSSPLSVTIGSVTSPVTRLTNVHGKLWCSIQGVIKILNSITLQVENQIQISSDSKPITNMVVSGNHVWISIQNSAYIKCFHSNSYDFLFEVNLAPPVNKMLSNCDDIIRQHKAACLRVTSLLACKDLVWVGTSAGVLLTISALQATLGNSGASPIVTGIPFGHTGHVRFLTCVDYGKLDDASKSSSTWLSKSKVESTNTLIISGGDGYEDFRNTGINPLSEVAGREDSTNHLLLWQV